MIREGWRNRAWHLTLALLVGVGLVALLAGNSLPALLYRVLIRGDRQPVAMMTGLDAFLRDAVPEGNLLLRFRGFDDKASGRGEFGPRDLASVMFFRSVHALYPQRVHVLPEDRPVVRGTEFITEPFDPGLAWLRARGIRRVLTFTRDGDGNIRQDVLAIPPE